MTKRKKSKRRQRWVVKAGSNMVVTGGPLLLRAWMQQLAELRSRHSVEVIWVTSGAIASAKARTHLSDGGGNLAKKQALSAIGQPLVIDLYNLCLQRHGLLGAQVLLTYSDLADRTRRRNLKNTLGQLLQWNVVPILNENDAVATEEIRFGDNDSLSARVAHAMSADRLVILTDVQGLYDADPRKTKGARLIRKLHKVSPGLIANTDPGAGTSRGTGGMRSKLLAAQTAMRAGIETWLVQGDLPSVLLRVAREDLVGTRIGGRS